MTRMRRDAGGQAVAVVVDGRRAAERSRGRRALRRPRCRRDGPRRRRRGAGDGGCDVRRAARRPAVASGSVSVKMLPCAGRALHRDVAAEQTREVARDRQAEAGAAVLAMRAAVGLAERLEDDRPAGAAGMPMPVSRTANATRPLGRVDTRSETSPAR